MTENVNDSKNVPAPPLPSASDATSNGVKSTDSALTTKDVSSPKANGSSDDSVFKRPAKSVEHVGEGAGSTEKEPNDSEAETDILSDPETTEPTKSETKVKSERIEADGDEIGHGLRRVNSHQDERSNGQLSPSGDSRDKHKRGPGERRRRKSSGAASTTASWTSSAHSRQGARQSPADAVPSPPHTAHSPSFPSGVRSRSQSITESKKRKLREDSNVKTSEPPRQRHKTESTARDTAAQRPPISPTTASSRQHKRSISTQSALQAAPGRRRRDTSSLVVNTHDHPDSNSDFTSDDDSSPRRQQQPRSQHNRIQRSSHRSVGSPARATMPKKDTDRFGATPLARAAEKGEYSDVVQAWNLKPKDLDRADYAGITPLQKAALHGHHDIVEFLISKGCRTDCQSDNRDTPLIDAVENGHIEVVKVLLNKGKVNPHHQNKKGQRAIDLLDEDDDHFEEISKELKEAMVRENDTSARDSDSVPPKNQLASSLLYNEYNTETLRDKAAEGNSKLVEELLNSNISPNIACGVAAARGGHDEILNVFIAVGLHPDPDPQKHSNTYMIVAIGRGHLKIIELLLAQESFDPTRKTREGLTYFELAEERRGPKWEREAELLKKAYDRWNARRGKKNGSSPRRERKPLPTPLNTSPPQLSRNIKVPRKSSPRPSERSSSPSSTRFKRPTAEKSTSVSEPNGKRRLMSGKELSTQRDAKRRRRVVDEDSDTGDDNVEDKRPAKKLATKRQSFSDGEEKKILKKKPSKDEDRLRVPQKMKKAASANGNSDHESDLERRRKTKKLAKEQRRSAEPTQMRKSSVAKPSSEPGSESDIRRKSKVSKDPLQKIKSERHESPVDSPRSTARSTPVPAADAISSRAASPAPPKQPSRTPTPVREARIAEAKAKEAEARRQAEEAEHKKEEEQRQAEEQRRAEEQRQAEIQRQAEEQRLLEERLKEEERQREIEAAKQKEAAAAEEQRVKRQQELDARAARLKKLPLAVRRACERGMDRPLHFDGDWLGITQGFFPIYVFPGASVDSSLPATEEWMLSHQAVGVLGLPDPDIALTFPTWEKRDVTDQQREAFVHQADMGKLAQEYQAPPESHPTHDANELLRQIAETREQMRTMQPLHFVKFADFKREVEEGTLIHFDGGLQGEQLVFGDGRNSAPVAVLTPITNGDNPSTPEPLPEETPTIRAQQVREMLRSLPIRKYAHLRITDFSTPPHTPSVDGTNGVPKRKSFMDLLKTTS